MISLDTNFGLDLRLHSFTILPLTIALPVPLTRRSAKSCTRVLMVTSRAASQHCLVVSYCNYSCKSIPGQHNKK